MENIMVNTLNRRKNSCKHMEIPTEDEVRALDRLRNIKKRVREIKKDLAQISSDSSFHEQRLLLENELLQLKGDWGEWEKKRDAAARERMIALGHLDPESEI